MASTSAFNLYTPLKHAHFCQSAWNYVNTKPLNFMIDSFIKITCCMLWQFTKHYFNQSYASFRVNSISLKKDEVFSKTNRDKICLCENLVNSEPELKSVEVQGWFYRYPPYFSAHNIPLYIIIQNFKQDCNHTDLMQSLTYYTAHNPPLFL
jgi:hypothetical protein